MWSGYMERMWNGAGQRVRPSVLRGHFRTLRACVVSGRTQKESRRTKNGTEPANAHGGALGIDIMKRCGWPPGTTTQRRPRECTEHRTRGRMPAEKACTEQHRIR